MKRIEKVYISGIGAVGGSYGSRIFDTCPEALSVIADKKRAGRYMEKGIKVNGRIYPFNYISPSDYPGEADLLVIAVKQHQLAQSINDIKNFVGEKTVILSLLNGIASEEIIAERYGMDKILHSFAVGIDAVREGTDIRFSSLGKIIFGSKDKSGGEKVYAVKDFFDRAGIPYSIPEDIIRELWWKFMMNVGINQVSAVLKADYGVFRDIIEARELMEMASLEVVAVAEKAGIDLTREDIAKYIAIANTLSPGGKTSMLQDIEGKRKTEVDIFSGTVIDLGKKYGVNTPVNSMLYKMIKTLEKMNE